MVATTTNEQHQYLDLVYCQFYHNHLNRGAPYELFLTKVFPSNFQLTRKCCENILYPDFFGICGTHLFDIFDINSENIFFEIYQIRLQLCYFLWFAIYNRKSRFIQHFNFRKRCLFFCSKLAKKGTQPSRLGDSEHILHNSNVPRPLFCCCWLL